MKPSATILVATLAACGDDGGAVCERRDVELRTAIVDPAALKFVTMPGGLGGGGSVIVGRSYMVLDESALAGNTKIPIVAPADMDLISYAHYNDPGDPDVPPQWALNFRLSCDVELGLAHINQVAPSIAEVATTPVASTSQDIPLRTPVHFAEGDIIGYKEFQDAYNVQSFDLIYADATVTNQFANQQRYENAEMRILHETCAFSDFSPALRDAYLAKVGTHGTGFLGPGMCRSASRDVPGTLAGSWFWNEDPTIDVFGGREGNYPDTIAVIDDLGKYVAIANLGPSISHHRVNADKPTYKRPELITDRHCYQLDLNNTFDTGYVDFSFLTPTSVRVVYSETGTCPAVFDGSSGRTYYR